MRLPADFTFHKVGNPWFSWTYVRTHGHDIVTATGQHVILTLSAVALGILLTGPLVLLARRSSWLRGGVLVGATALYAIPSLAFIVALYPIFGLSKWTVVLPLAVYSLIILVRNTLTGLDEVSAEAVDAARGMGMSDATIFLKVRLPIAVPSMLAGLRLAVVSTIELVVIGGYVGQGGYGSKILEGYYDNEYHAEILTYVALTVLLALVADVLLLLLQRLVTPWRRRMADS